MLAIVSVRVIRQGLTEHVAAIVLLGAILPNVGRDAQEHHQVILWGVPLRVQTSHDEETLASVEFPGGGEQHAA
jgi:hypothetical protein